MEDRRSRGVPSGSRLRLPGKMGGIGLLLIVGVVVLSGGDLGQVLSLLLGGGSAPVTQQLPDPGSRNEVDQETSAFVSVVLRDTEITWHNLFARAGGAYEEPRLVLFSEAVASACGYATAVTGPFYCPGDTRIYLDTGFFRELERLGAPGDFAQAYVIAHEVGHHVQNVQGTLTRVRRLQQRAGSTQANALQVLVELQADCLAGVWASHAETQRDLLEAGDIEEGLQAAASIGDDRLQRNAGRRVQPESFTHGSSAQRVEWFRRGLESGSPAACDTGLPQGS